MESVKLSPSTLFAEGRPVFGVACLDDQVFVIRRHGADVEVYDVNCSYKLLKRLKVNKPRNPLDIAACAQKKRVYVLDGLDPSGRIFAVETQQQTSEDATSPSSSNSSKSWSVGEMAMNISVTSSATIVVTCGKVAQLREFSDDGELVRQISLNSELVSAQHAVQLDALDHFVVCHGWMDDKLHRVCVVDAQDAESPPSHVYGSHRGSSSTNSLHNASHLGVDPQRRCVFVVDMGNRRVVALDSTLRQLTDVPVLDKKRLPSRMCLDAERCLLYVACNEWKDVFWTSGSVNVFSVCYT